MYVHKYWKLFDFFPAFSALTTDTVGCWLGVRKSVRPAKKLNGEVVAWLSVWCEMQMICIWSS